MIDFIIYSPRFYEYLTWAVLALAAFNFAQIAYLIWNKSRVESIERRRDEIKRLAATAVVTSLNPSEILPRPSAEHEFTAYAESIANMLDNFEGEIAARALSLFKEFGIEDHFRRLARSRSWYRRCGAVDMLAVFRLESSRDLFREMFAGENSPEVKYRLIRGLSLIARGHDDIRELAILLSSLPYLTAKYTEDVFFNVISNLKAAGLEDEFGLFMRDTMKDDQVLTHVKRDCLTACHAAVCEKGRGLLKDYYAAHPGEPEILAACVKSLARIGDFTLLAEALRHPDWRVKLSALKSAHLCCEELTEEISVLLSDANYHVRLNAASALAKAGERGIAALRRAAASEDKFEARMAAYALEQEGA